MLPHLNPDDYDKVAKSYQEMSDQRSERFDRTLSRVDKTSRWFIGIIGSVIFATFAVGVWWNELTISRNAHQKGIEALKAEATYFKEMVSTANQLIISNKNERISQIDAISDRLRDHDEFVRKYRTVIDNLEFMRVHGISFKEDFQQRNGYPAPTTAPVK